MKYPLFTVPFFLFFGGQRSFHSSLCKNQLTALTDGKMGSFAAHQHSPPRRLVRMLAFGLENQVLGMTQNERGELM